VVLFRFPRQSIVDWLVECRAREASSRREGTRASSGWARSCSIGLPLVVFAVDSLIMHQTLLGNYPMIARWQMHRYLLRQSLTFFANEFAGRVATKVMQTSLAVRETVMKILDVFVYVVTYFVSMIAVVANAQTSGWWRR
jgi:ATP-binding cassette subfamily B multidrug efflux pump